MAAHNQTTQSQIGNSTPPPKKPATLLLGVVMRWRPTIKPPKARSVTPPPQKKPVTLLLGVTLTMSPSALFAAAYAFWTLPQLLPRPRDAAFGCCGGWRGAGWWLGERLDLAPAIAQAKAGSV